MRVAVIGAGSWGTAIAKLMADCDHEVRLWAFEKEVVADIEAHRENKTFLPGFVLPDNLTASGDLRAVVEDAELVFSVSPSHVVRHVMGEIGPYLPANVPIVSASKGIENESLMVVSEILEDVLPLRCHPYLAYLSGPSFATEVAARHPTAVCVAAYSEKLAKQVQAAITVPYFRVYTSTDVVGVEMGGALKNVIAIAVGVASGMGMGDNTRAGMITRGLNEITRLSMRRGANPLTLMGLSGMGDLVLTCCGPLSRNRTVGELLGKGHKLADILGDMKMVAEGVKTARSVYHLSTKLGVEMPISHQAYYVLHEDKPVEKALADLLARAQKREFEY
jgi:glycerol-3-phosphate dehydrogenase (NAD(P)+)